jgi:hypothetical protein
MQFQTTHSYRDQFLFSTTTIQSTCPKSRTHQQQLTCPPLALDYRLYHMPEVSSRSGPVTVKDTHSPGGNRNTEVYTAQAWDCTGALTLFEIWGIH